MKKKIVPILLSLVLFVPIVEGQIKKGMSLFDFSANYNIPDYKTSDIFKSLKAGDFSRRPSGIKTSYNLSLGYDKMVSTRFMLGGSFSIHQSLEESFFRTGSNSGTSFRQWLVTQSHYLNTVFQGRVRYYFTTKKFAAFAYLAPSWATTRYSQDLYYNKMIKLSADVGLGFNLFIHSNIALEFIFKTPFFRHTIRGFHFNSFIPDKKYIASLGFQFFIDNFHFSSSEFLAESTLKRGNFNVAGLLQFQSEVDDGQNSFQIAPRLKYFFTDHTTLNLGFALGRFDNYTLANFTIGTGFYIKLAKRIYLLHEIELSTTLVLNGFGNGETEIALPTSLSLNYFHKNKRYFIGSSYIYYPNGSPFRFVPLKGIEEPWTFFGGLEYYVIENLSMLARLNMLVDNETTSERFEPKVHLNLSLGFNFWL